LVPEGIVGRVPYKGELNEVCFSSLEVFVQEWGLGSKDINFTETGRFVRITASGINESHPHNVTITKESQLLNNNKVE
jgi:IMP dehydrogenase